MNLAELRQAARSIWAIALAGADPAEAVRHSLRLVPGGIEVGGVLVPVPGCIVVIGAGKASVRMARAVEAVLGDRIRGGVVTTKYGHGEPLSRIEVIEAGHPVPDAAGVSAVERTLAGVTGLTADDLVLTLISGGGSALWPAPSPGISLEDKQAVTSALLRAGSSIQEVNTVRKHLSSIKGGQLVRQVSPARLVSLIVSDIVGDPLDMIASGPTVPDPTTAADALEVISRYGVRVPDSVRNRLQRASANSAEGETPKPGSPEFDGVRNVIVASNRVVVDAARAEAKRLGFAVHVLSDRLTGDSDECGRRFAEIVREGVPDAPAAFLAAGETTVIVRGTGQGGRNQEMAAAFAQTLSGASGEFCFASVATDGTDGPTDAAGALVDAGSWERARAAGVDPDVLLANNDTYALHVASGDLIVTGPTRTNLMDLQILLTGGRD